MKGNYTRNYLDKMLVKHQLTDIFTEKSVAYLSIRKFDKKEVVLYDKEEFSVLSIVIEGRLKVVPSSMEGKSTLIDYIEKGAVLGEIEYFCETQNIHTVEACKETILLDIPFCIIEEELKYHAPFLLFMCNRLSQKLSSLSISHSKQLLMSTKTLLCKYILELSEQYGTEKIPIKYIEIAQRIGKSDRHVHRVMSELIKDEMVAKEERGYIRILNMEQLYNMIKEI